MQKEQVLKEHVIKAVATNVRKLMNEASLSSSDLAKKCNITTGTISKILKGTMSISLSLAIQLAEGLEVDINDILTGVIEKKERHTEEKKTKIHKHQPASIGILSINNRRITCIKDYTGTVLGTSELEGGLDLAETSGALLSSIQQSIAAALPNPGTMHGDLQSKLKNTIINLVTQSYEFEDTREKFANFAKRYFKDVLLFSDWQITYLSTFKSKPGISLITDKGVSLSYLNDGELKKLGGWKFPVYDLGGENWFGIETIRHTIEAVEGYIPMTDLAQTIMMKFNRKIEKITETCFKGTKDHDIYCTFAEPMLRAYLMGDKDAKKLIEYGFEQIKRLIDRVDTIVGKKLNIALYGSLAGIYKPFLSPDRLVTPSTEFEKADILADITKESLEKYGIKYE